MHVDQFALARRRFCALSTHGSATLYSIRARLPIQRFITAGRLHVLCQSEYQKDGRSAREKVQANPAYQRLKNAAWKDSYVPSETLKAPGSVPKHLLTEDEQRSQQTVIKGSITEQLQGAEHAERPSEQQEVQPDASSSAISSSGATSQPNGEPGTEEHVQQRELQQKEAGPPNLVEAQRHSRSTRVRFGVQFHAQFGQRMRVVGSHENLGSWQASCGAELQWAQGDNWSCIVELPAGAVVEYKYVLLEGDGARAIAWQQGNNAVLAVGHAGEDVEVRDTWEASPAASVTVAGQTTTREGRLLSWATEIEALFAAQRSELRKSRMELVAAQEEAALAREEARRFRNELRASEAERVKAEMKVKELTTSNSLLRTQLADTTLSFRTALETTHQFLLEAEEAMRSKPEDSDAENADPVGDSLAPESGGGPSTAAASSNRNGSSDPLGEAGPALGGAAPADSRAGDAPGAALPAAVNQEGILGAPPKRTARQPRKTAGKSSKPKRARKKRGPESQEEGVPPEALGTGASPGDAPLGNTNHVNGFDPLASPLTNGAPGAAVEEPPSELPAEIEASS